MTKSKTIKKSFIISLSAIGFIIIFVLFLNYYFESTTSDDNKPPNLESETSKYEGALIDKEFGFYEFESSDETRFVDPEFSTFKDANKGLNYYYPKVDLTVGRIINEGIKPEKGLKVLFAFYTAEPTLYNDEDCFLVFPMGPYADTCPIPFNEIYNFTVPRNKGFIIIANKEFEYNYSILADSNTLASNFSLSPPTDGQGWILRPLSPDVNLYDPNIQAVWLQNAPDEFVEIADFRNIEVSRPYKMAWIQYSGEPGDSISIQEEGATDNPATGDPDSQ